MFNIHLFSRFRNILIILILLFLIFPSNVLAKKRKKRRSKPIDKWEIRLTLNTIYDNNILKYSTKYIERFQNREDEGRFNINTYDDLILYNQLKISYSFRLFNRLKSTASVEFQKRFYTNNPIKNWYYSKIAYRQQLPIRTEIYFSYNFIPNFYVRHYRDEDWINVYGYTSETFQPFEFAKDNFAFWLQKSFLKSTRIRVYYNYMRYFHNEHFTEYDSENSLLGFRFYQSLNKKLNLNFGYNFIISETDVIKDETDASYEEDIFTLGLEYKLPKLFGKSNQFNIGTQYSHRYYQTDNNPILDPVHSGREDSNYRLSLDYNIRMHKSLNLTGIFNWYERKSTSTMKENEITLADEKNYKQYQTGLKITYIFKY